MGWTCERSLDDVAAFTPILCALGVRDAHADEYGEPIPWTAAVLFVVMNWRWLCRQEASGWPTPEA